MIPDRDTDPKEGMKNTGNSKYMSKFKILFFSF